MSYKPKLATRLLQQMLSDFLLCVSSFLAATFFIRTQWLSLATVFKTQHDSMQRNKGLLRRGVSASIAIARIREIAEREIRLCIQYVYKSLGISSSANPQAEYSSPLPVVFYMTSGFL